jgi:SAM-dependent methyltransferase
MDYRKGYFTKEYTYSRKGDEEKYFKNPQSRIKFSRVLELCGDVSGKEVLDSGCGGGLFSITLARRGGRLTSLDLAEGAVSSVKEWASEEGLRIDGEVSALEVFKTGKRFDLIIALDSIMYSDDVNPQARSIASLLKPGGRAIISVPNLWQCTSLLSLFDYFPLSIIKKIKGGGKVKGYSKHLPWVWESRFRRAGLSIERHASILMIPPLKSKRLETWFSKSWLALPFLYMERILYRKFPFCYGGYGFIFSARKPGNA